MSDSLKRAAEDGVLFSGGNAGRFGPGNRVVVGEGAVRRSECPELDRTFGVNNVEGLDTYARCYEFTHWSAVMFALGKLLCPISTSSAFINVYIYINAGIPKPSRAQMTDYRQLNALIRPRPDGVGMGDGGQRVRGRPRRRRRAGGGAGSSGMMDVEDLPTAVSEARNNNNNNNNNNRNNTVVVVAAAAAPLSPQLRPLQQQVCRWEQFYQELLAEQAEFQRQDQRWVPESDEENEAERIRQEQRAEQQQQQQQQQQVREFEMAESVNMDHPRNHHNHHVVAAATAATAASLDTEDEGDAVRVQFQMRYEHYRAELDELYAREGLEAILYADETAAALAGSESPFVQRTTVPGPLEPAEEGMYIYIYIYVCVSPISSSLHKCMYIFPYRGGGEGGLDRRRRLRGATSAQPGCRRGSSSGRHGGQSGVDLHTSEADGGGEDGRPADSRTFVART